MSLVSLSLPSDGQRIDAADVNVPFTALATAINGGLDSTNISSLTGTKLQSGTVPTTALDSSFQTGWLSLGQTLVYGTNNGNKEYTVTATADLTSVLSPGMRLKTTRATTPPTQCADFESSSSQYASRTAPSGIIFTDDFTVEAWVKLESYTGADQAVLSRFDGTNGFIFAINSAGQVYLQGKSSTRTVLSYQSVPIGQWTHIAATLDMSGGAGQVYINGTAVASAVSGAGTSLTQAGNLQIGAYNSTNFFDGEMTEVRLWPSVRTQQQLRDNMNVSLTGSEGMLSLYKLNGNFNDSTANANNLTPAGGAVSTVLDNPMKATEYALVTAVSYANPTTTITLHTGEGNNIPNGTLNNAFYSTHQTPQGWPNITWSWLILMGATFSTTSVTPTQIPGLSISPTIPSTAKRVKVTMGARNVYNSSATAYISVSAWKGTVVSGQRLGEVNSYTAISGGGDQPIALTAFDTAGSGITTYNMALHTSANTANLFADVTRQAFMLVEVQ